MFIIYKFKKYIFTAIHAHAHIYHRIKLKIQTILDLLDVAKSGSSATDLLSTLWYRSYKL